MNPITEPWRVGAAKIEVTPPPSVPYLGHTIGPRHAPFSGVHDPLLARAIVLQAGDQRAAIISVDSIGFSRRLLGPSRDFTAELRHRVTQATGIQSSHLMLTATHAHSTPETIGFRPLLEHAGAGAWLASMLDRLVSVVQSAAARLQPALLKVMSSRVEGVAVNRRAPLFAPQDVERCAPLDPVLHVLSFESTSGKSIAAMAHFACHPVAVQAQPLISADFPGALTARVESHATGSPVLLFLQGACADVNPLRGPTKQFDDVHRYGSILSDAVLQLLSGKRRQPPQPCRLGVLCQTLSLSSRPLPDAAAHAAEGKALEAALQRAAGTAQVQEAQLAWALWREGWQRVQLGLGPFDAEVQVMAVGDVAMVGLPGEPFVVSDRAIRARSTAPHTLTVGFANDYLGYFTPPESWQVGGYETRLGMGSYVNARAADLLVDSGVNLIDRLFQRASL